MRDVIVVGAGPMGCYFGGRLADEGLEVTILEEHNQIGHPMCCAGIVGAQGLKEVGLDPEDWSLNPLEAGVFNSPNGQSIRLSRGRTEAHAIDRAKFDEDLVKRSVSKGAEIWVSSKCTGVSLEEEKVKVKVERRGGSEVLEGRMVVGADGANSTVAKEFGLVKDFEPTVGAQVEVVKKEEDRKAKVYFGNSISKDFFAWVVPAGDVYRVGLGDRTGNVVQRLLKFLKDTPITNKVDGAIKLTTGVIPKPSSRKIYDDRVLLVGDAAGQVKPLTGGGLYMGLKCALMGSETALRALEEEPKEELLSGYAEKVKQEFGMEFEWGNRLRRSYSQMSDEDISELFELFKVPEVKEVILENADFDHHAKLIDALVEEGPSLIGKIGAGRLFKYLGMFLGT